MPDPNASTLTITITKDLTYTYNDGTGDPQPIQVNDIRGRIQPKLDAMHGTDKVVFVDFDDAVPWNLVVSTMDTIRGIATDVTTTTSRSRSRSARKKTPPPRLNRGCDSDSEPGAQLVTRRDVLTVAGADRRWY